MVASARMEVAVGLSARETGNAQLVSCVMVCIATESAALQRANVPKDGMWSMALSDAAIDTPVRRARSPAYADSRESAWSVISTMNAEKEVTAVRMESAGSSRHAEKITGVLHSRPAQRMDTAGNTVLTNRTALMTPCARITTAIEHDAGVMAIARQDGCRSADRWSAVWSLVRTGDL